MGARGCNFEFAKHPAAAILAGPGLTKAAGLAKGIDHSGRPSK